MSTAAVPDSGKFGRFEILAAQRRLQVDGQPVALGSRAFDLLTALVQRRDRIVPKEELIDAVWPGLVVEDNNLQVQISALRKVLGVQAIATVPGRGYQFTLAEVAPPHDPPPARPTPARVLRSALRAPRLLVVDDNKVNRLMLSRTLELLGHDVASADNGRTALEKLHAEPFDLLLLDLEMPEMSGFDLLEHRNNDAAIRDVPVIVTSSLEGVSEVARCIELGADDFLRKPVNPVLLRARVDASLERKFLRDRERELLARLGAGPLSAPEAMPDARRTEVTVLAACVQTGDRPAAPVPAPETLELLSTWTTLMVDAIEGHGGRVSQMTGDALVAVFGASGPMAEDDDAPWASVQAAREMTGLIALFNSERHGAGKSPVTLSIGLASGEVVTGHAGTPKRSAHVCVGAAVQRAGRLAALGAPREPMVLMDGATQAALAGRIATEAVPATRWSAGPVADAIHALLST